METTLNEGKSFEEENGVETNTFQVTVSHIMLSAAFFFVKCSIYFTQTQRVVQHDCLLSKARDYFYTH